MLPHDRLSGNEHEGMLDEPADVVAGFMLRPLERVGAEVEKRSAGASWIIGCDQTPNPCGLLFQENRLPLVVSKTGKVAVVGPVEEFAAFVRAFAGEKVALIVTVEMNFEVLARRVITLTAACS